VGVHKCRARDCTLEAQARHLCAMHYAQIRRHGRLHASNRRDICLVIGCEKKHYGRGYCQKHYRQLVRTGKITEVKQREKATCFIATCQRKRFSRGLCNTHHRFYLFKVVHKGSSWEAVDRIIADLNQNSLANRNRLDTIIERHRILKNAQNAYFKKEVLRDMLEETILGSDDLAGDLGGLDAIVDSGEHDDVIGRKEGWDELDNVR